MGDVRSFVAIRLAGAGRTAVEALLRRLQAEAGGGAGNVAGDVAKHVSKPVATNIAWTRPENLHVTLKFLGAVSPERLEALAGSLAAVAAGQEAFVLAVRGTGAFPSLARPRAFWVGVESAALAPLATAVDAACAGHGFVRETRALRPHVTLGRLRRSAAPGRSRAAPALLERLVADGDTAFGGSPAEALVLFRSDLGPGGARYTPLGSWCFGGRVPPPPRRGEARR